MLDIMRAVGVYNGLVPAANGQAFPMPIAMYKALDFSAVATVFVDTTIEEQNALIQFIQTIYIDNGNNENPLTLEIGNSLQRLIVPPQTQGYWPILVPQAAVLEFSTTIAEALEVYIQLLNVPMPMASWNVVSSSGGGGGGGGSTPYQADFTDFSGTITAGGTSQTCIPANANRRRYVIENPADAPNGESLFVNFGGAPADSPSALTSFEILPGGYIDSESGPVDTSEITVNAATTGHVYIAKES